MLNFDNTNYNLMNDEIFIENKIVKYMAWCAKSNIILNRRKVSNYKLNPIFPNSTLILDINFKNLVSNMRLLNSKILNETYKFGFSKIKPNTELLEKRNFSEIANHKNGEESDYWRKFIEILNYKNGKKHCYSRNLRVNRIRKIVVYEQFINSILVLNNALVLISIMDLSLYFKYSTNIILCDSILLGSFFVLINYFESWIRFNKKKFNS